MLTFPNSSAKIWLVTDASGTAVGAVVEQRIRDAWQPLSFYSNRFSSSQLKYSAYDRELTAIYQAVKHFRHFLEGTNFSIYTDYKPLIYAFLQKPDQASPRQMKQSSYISQFTTKIKFIEGPRNAVTDSLSRIESDFRISSVCPSYYHSKQLTTS